MEFVSDGARARTLDDAGGDALDRLMAALAVARALTAPSPQPADLPAAYALEGYVYV